MQSTVSKLRDIFVSYKINGYIIPHSDEYQNEYTPNSTKRLEYITGFTGSNGVAIVTKNNKYFWTDGRYKIQAEKEVPDYIICERDFASVEGTKIGYNPMLFTKSQLELFSPKLDLVPINEDLVDLIWKDKPKLSDEKAYLYPLKYAGMSAEEKLKITCKNFVNKAKYALITEPDCICWLLNIRGHDIEYVPVILCYMLLSDNEVICFTDLSKITKDVKNSLPFVQFKDQKEIFDMLKSIRDSILIDPIFCSLGMQSFISNKVEGMNPCLLPRACKNNVEIESIKQGHISDAVAVCEGFAWIENNLGITENDIALKLTELRKKQEGYVMDSFPTIAGFKENGAIIHYRAPAADSKIIEGDGLLLVDSGAHYWGCTTDVTRILVFGIPTEEQKIRYTQVLKGHIALASINVPVGTLGGALDICARQYLWEDGVDYVHGTGHGVGNMLSVHEYPRYIWSSKSNVELKEGMILSDEPGFYKEGEFGIRIENILYIKKSKYKGFLECEMLTLVPYSRDLIKVEMLSDKDKKFLKSYYDKIRQLILPKLNYESKKWCEYQLEIFCMR